MRQKVSASETSSQYLFGGWFRIISSDLWIQQFESILCFVMKRIGVFSAWCTNHFERCSFTRALTCHCSIQLILKSLLSMRFQTKKSFSKLIFQLDRRINIHRLMMGELPIKFHSEYSTVMTMSSYVFFSSYVDLWIRFSRQFGVYITLFKTCMSSQTVAYNPSNYPQAIKMQMPYIPAP